MFSDIGFVDSRNVFEDITTSIYVEEDNDFFYLMY
jgi:hypothetical protein